VAVTTAHASGILSVAASGNDGLINAMSYPACASKAVSVGAVYGIAVSEDLTWQVDGSAGKTCTDRAPRQDAIACFTNW
jgi:hypothetical protein